MRSRRRWTSYGSRRRDASSRFFAMGDTADARREQLLKRLPPSREELEPCAPTRATPSRSQVTIDEVLGSTMISYPHLDDGARRWRSAAAATSRHEDRRTPQLRAPIVRVTASQQRLRPTPMATSSSAPPSAAQTTRDTAGDAYEQAGVGPDDLDLVQVHDALPSRNSSTTSCWGSAATAKETDSWLRVPPARRAGPILDRWRAHRRGHPGGPTRLALDPRDDPATCHGPEPAKSNARIGLCTWLGRVGLRRHILQRTQG